MHSPDRKTYSFLSGGGEMGELVRAYDWENSIIGPVDNWPQSLCNTLSFLLNSKFPMFLWWGEELIQFYNDGYRPSFGQEGKHPTALGQRGADCWQEIWPDIKPLIDQIFAGGEASWSEDQLLPIYRNGKLEDVYWTFSYSPVYDNGKVAGVFVTCSETTEKVKTIRQLKESEQQLSFTIEAAEFGTWDYNPLTKSLLINNRLKDWFGLPHEEHPGWKAIISAIIETDRPKVSQAIKYAMTHESGGFYDTEYTVRHPQTSVERIFRAKGRAWFNEEKVPQRFNGTLQDVTKEVLSRRKTEESDLFARSIIENSPVAQVVFVGEDMIISIINERMLEMMGRTSDILGKSFYEALPELEGPLRERLKKVYETGETYNQPEERLELIRFGKPYTGYYNYTYQAIADSSGLIYGIMVTAWDITQQVEVRHKIEEEKERTRIAIGAGELGVFEVDLTTDELVANDRFNEIYGFEKTMRREDYVATCHPDDLPIRAAALEWGMKNGAFEYETRFNTKGALRWIKSKGHIVYDSQQQPVKIFGVIQDITEQKTFSEALSKQVEERTLELHRSNEDLMQFAHVASHDLKEPVRKVKTFTGRLQDEFGAVLPEKADLYLDKIKNATDRMFSMIDGVLSYSTFSSSEQKNEQVNLSEVIDNIETDLEVLIQQKNAAIHRTHLPVIEGSPVLIYQLFYNLINNSLKFSKHGQKTHISITAATVVVHGSDMTQIVVSDNGIGMDPQYTGNIFNAFTRLNSKDAYEGTGLGLALCKKIAERHNGSISAAGTTTDGAIFTILLPFQQFKKII